MPENPPNQRDDRRPGQPRRAPQGERGQPGWRVQPAPDGRGMPPEKPRSPWGGFGRRWLIIVLILLGLNFWISSLIPSGHERIRIPYNPTFIQQIKSGNVKDISSKGTTVQGTFRKPVTYPQKGGKSSQYFDTEVPTFANTDQLSTLLQKNDVTVNANPPEQGRSFIANLLLGFGPTLLLIGIFVWFARRAAQAGGGGMLGSFGRSRARRIEASEQTVTFDDVAGIDEAKAELTEIVDFLRNPEKYGRLGGKIPRGVLLSGPPGTGKTLLARAVAGQASVPFFSMSASEFVEMIVGVGASRVRDLFQQAKAAAPAIIFIDELDAIGRSRAGGAPGFGGGSDEREQTLNQILTEMDGFDPAIGVIVLAATNRPEVLDPALLRPGRFDRRVTVQPPDTNGRRKILEVHTRSVPLGPDVDLGRLAATTVGMVGADLANLVNEAALTAARRGREHVTHDDFTDALEKIVLGSERKIVMSERDRRRTAYHEAGHALVGMLTPGADPVRKVSIIPRGPALGVTLSAPEADRFSYDRDYLLGRIKVALAGRVAERLVFDDLTTGAESDIEQLTQIARQMVGRWGMSEAIGPVSVIQRDGQGPLLPGSGEASEETQRLVDEEVRRLVDRTEKEVRSLLSENRDRLDALVTALLDKETLDQDEAYGAAGVEPPPPAEERDRLQAVGGEPT